MKRILLTLGGLLITSSQLLAQLTIEQKIEQIYPAAQYPMDNHFKESLIYLLEERITIYENNGVDSNKYPLLSSVPLLNKYNPTLQKITEEGYHPETFNPLKYSLPFFVYDFNPLHFFIDGTNLILEIKPQ